MATAARAASRQLEVMLLKQSDCSSSQESAQADAEEQQQGAAAAAVPSRNYSLEEMEALVSAVEEWVDTKQNGTVNWDWIKQSRPQLSGRTPTALRQKWVSLLDGQNTAPAELRERINKLGSRLPLLDSLIEEPRNKTSIFFTTDETEALLDGVIEHGCERTSWGLIIRRDQELGKVLRNRDKKALSTKWTSMLKNNGGAKLPKRLHSKWKAALEKAIQQQQAEMPQQLVAAGEAAGAAAAGGTAAGAAAAGGTAAGAAAAGGTAAGAAAAGGTAAGAAVAGVTAAGAAAANEATAASAAAAGNGQPRVAGPNSKANKKVPNTAAGSGRQTVPVQERRRRGREPTAAAAAATDARGVDGSGSDHHDRDKGDGSGGDDDGEGGGTQQGAATRRRKRQRLDGT
ncbi:hypothetical protein PLESTF_001804600 [Pleodorina starrii]|nr:hypothetical protein PLESTF_001804600 [Pleodorina starrii]